MKLYLKTLILCVLSLLFIFSNISIANQKPVMVDKFFVLQWSNAIESYEGVPLRIYKGANRCYVEAGERPYSLASFFDNQKEYLNKLKNGLEKLDQLRNQNKNDKIIINQVKNQMRNGRIHTISSKLISTLGGSVQYLEIIITDNAQLPNKVKVRLKYDGTIKKYIKAIEKTQ